MEIDLAIRRAIGFEMARGGDDKAGWLTFNHCDFPAPWVAVVRVPSTGRASSRCCTGFCRPAYDVPAVARIERRTQLVAVTIAESWSA
jgi:hypothetical protein